MATLDTFFVKLAQPSRVVVTGAHTNDSGKVEIANSHAASTSKNTTKSSPEKQRNKRSHDGGISSNRLKTRKKHKVVIDTEDKNESVLLTRTEIVINDVELSDVVLESVSGINEVLNSEPAEISYEDFLAANKTTCVYIDGVGSNRDEVDVDRKISVPAAADKHSDSVVEKAHESNKIYDLELHLDHACNVEEAVEVPASMVVSKDIRSFFGKATAATKQTNDKKLCATLVKVKAEIHQDQNIQMAVLSNKQSTSSNRHVDLARWQRANIVITNADLDIEIIDTGDAAKGAASDFKDANIAVLEKSQVDINCDVNGLTALTCTPCRIVSGNESFPIDKQPPSSSVKTIEDTRISVKSTLTERDSKLTNRKKIKSKQSCLLDVGAKRETCAVDMECYVIPNRAIDQDADIGTVGATDDLIVQVKKSTNEMGCTQSKLILQRYVWFKNNSNF